MSEENLLEIKGLKYGVNDFEILKGIDLAAGKGEFIGLIGPNGAGKTTLLKCINGINRIRGSVKIGGLDTGKSGSRDIARKVALMHQNTSVTFPFPVIDIVLTGRYPYLKRIGGESPEDYKIARKYMEFTDVLKFESAPVTRLSGGERQRVFFAKVLAQETGLILLDEPAASLDIAYEEQIFRYSSELCSRGRTVVAAAHDLKTAARYCTRLVLMKDGRIIADGSPDEVLTTGNLSAAYGVNALVYRNRITGLLDFHIHGEKSLSPGKKVHVIGGGGAASPVIRLLFENGCKITAGVFAHGDSDLGCAEIFGIECLSGNPFSEIAEELYTANIEMIKSADLTILCNMPFGMQNIKNLEAALHARKLVIIEDDDPSARDFTGGRALEIYVKLKKNAIVTDMARLHEVI